MGIRIYLTGRVTVEVDGRLVIQERQLRGRQDRLALVFLACHRTQPVTRERLAEVLWPEEMPMAWQTGMSALLSRLRGLLMCDDLRAYGPSISKGFGQYQLCLPADTWVDLEAAATSIDEAEGALRAGDPRRAFSPAAVAAAIARRPFLSGDDGEWAELQRRKLHRVLVRALECLCRVWLLVGEPVLAVEAASEAVSLDPYHESSYQLLMRAYRADGNRPEALRTYHRLQTLLAQELDTQPSSESEALFLELR